MPFSQNVLSHGAFHFGFLGTGFELQPLIQSTELEKVYLHLNLVGGGWASGGSGAKEASCQGNRDGELSTGMHEQQSKAEAFQTQLPSRSAGRPALLVFWSRLRFVLLASTI